MLLLPLNILSFLTPGYRTSTVYLITLLCALNVSGTYALDKVNITIDGLDGELLKNVLAHLSLEQQKNHPQFSSQRIKRLHQQTPDEIKHALKPFGYYRAAVTAELASVNATEWQAHYHVNLGTPLKLHTVDLTIVGEGQQDTALQKVIADLPLKVGDTFNYPRYEHVKKALKNFAVENGYFDARFNHHEIRIDEKAYHASVFIHFDTGKRYHFGEVTFTQMEPEPSADLPFEKIDETLLRRYLNFKPGDPFSSHALLAFKNTLMSSDYFDGVEFNQQYVDTDKSVPIEVILIFRKKSKYSFAIGYGTDTGPRGSIGWERRRINQYGHRFSLNAQLSQIRNVATARYYIPVGDAPTDNVALTARYKDENTKTSDSTLLSTSIDKNHTRYLFGYPVQEILGLEYRDERYTIGNYAGHAKLLMPNISWLYTQADNRLYTWHGHKIQLKIQGALEDVGSNTSFLQTLLQGVFIRKLFDSGRLITRGEVGYTLITTLLNGEFNDLPPSIRFFAGGDRSVRGYDYNTLGIKNDQGYVIGGQQLLVGSVEYEHKILKKWSVAAFYDVGNAFNNFSEPLKHGTGVGVRWQSPVGLLRVDVAAALSEEGHPWRLHITIGPDF